MRLRRQRSIRKLSQLLIITVILALYFFLRADLTAQLVNTIFGAQTSEYSGGLIDDVQIIRCYHWFRQCEVLLNHANGGKLALWNRVSKNFSAETSYAIESGLLYDAYLYVHRYQKSSKSTPISDFAISKDPSTVPLRVSADVQRLIQSSDSSVFHKHVYRQKKSIWDHLNPWNYNSHKDVHLLGEDWKYKGAGLWYKLQNRDDPLVNIEIYLGAGFVEGRPHWKEVIHEYFRPFSNENEYVPISITRKAGTLPDDGAEPFDSSLHLNLRNGHGNSLKILQITDVHFRSSDDSISILNEFQTTNFITSALKFEYPDLVVITGDFLDGSNSYDYQTCIMKLVQPMIQKGIPYAFSFGYMDFSSFATQAQVKRFITGLPFCMNKWSSTDNHMAIEARLGSGAGVIVYVLDSFNNVEPFFVEREKIPSSKYSLAFRHLPIKEYRPEGLFPLIGQYNERSKLQLNTKVDRNMGRILKAFNIMALSCGYEHNNDCCLHSDDKIWLCYGGSTGVGLKRVAGLSANIRVFKIDDDKGEVTSWKRNIRSIDSVYDYQYITKIETQI